MERPDAENSVGANGPGPLAGIGRTTLPKPPPLTQYLAECHRSFADERAGELASYIPELTKADPEQFGIALATVDGHVHAVGDADAPFTIQSVSKAFVFGLALEMVGEQAVAETIGLEPSGEAFNSIRLSAKNRPFNPMVNSGAIACSGLIQNADPEGAFERIRETLGRFAGRKLKLDEAVYRSESQTGDGNRAIAWLLRKNGALSGDVDAILDVYFRQCALLVTARDLAIMGATLAANGVNPFTGETVIRPETAARVLSIMVSSGMYDYSGEWIYRVGLPAKSGVGGGIVATLLTQLGLGVYSPRLDPLGNSVRGLKVCEHLSSHFGLHLLNRIGDVPSCIAAEYTLRDVHSYRDRRAKDLALLKKHGRAAKIVELGGALNFVQADHICRRFDPSQDYDVVVFDLRRLASVSPAATRLFVRLVKDLDERGVRVVLSSVDRERSAGRRLIEALGPAEEAGYRELPTLNEATGWAEDQIIYLRGGFDRRKTNTGLRSQRLLEDLTPAQVKLVEKAGEQVSFRSGQKLIEAGAAGDSVYFLLNGMVGVLLPSGVRLATLYAGTCFGELALIDGAAGRTANVVADSPGAALRLSLEAFNGLRQSDPEITETILRNIGRVLMQRLVNADNKVEALSRS